MQPDPTPVFLLDVDNTLLDNDEIQRDLRRYLVEKFGLESEKHDRAPFEQLRSELGYADHLGALQRYRIEHPRDPHLLEVSSYLLDYPFVDWPYRRALDVVNRLRQRGHTVIFSDGDVALQPHKVRRSGLSEAVDGHVIIYVHKEQMLDDVEQRYPTDHYIVVDDKIRVLDAIRRVWGERTTTVFVRQGHYAHDPDVVSRFPPADVTVPTIGDLFTDEQIDVHRATKSR